MTPLYDATDTAPNNESDQSVYANTKFGPCNKPLTLDFLAGRNTVGRVGEPLSTFFVRNPNGTINTGQTANFCDIGQLFITTVGLSYPGQVGKLYVEYDVEFFLRKLPTDLLTIFPPFGEFIRTVGSPPINSGTNFIQAVVDRQSTLTSRTSVTFDGLNHVSVKNNATYPRTFQCYYGCCATGGSGTVYITGPGLSWSTATAGVTTSNDWNTAATVPQFSYAASADGTAITPLLNSNTIMTITNVTIPAGVSASLTPNGGGFNTFNCSALGSMSWDLLILEVNPLAYAAPKKSDLECKYDLLLKKVNSMCLKVDVDREEEKFCPYECHRCNKTTTQVCEILGKMYCHKCVDVLDTDTPNTTPLSHSSKKK